MCQSNRNSSAYNPKIFKNYKNLEKNFSLTGLEIIFCRFKKCFGDIWCRSDKFSLKSVE